MSLKYQYEISEISIWLWLNVTLKYHPKKAIPSVIICILFKPADQCIPTRFRNERQHESVKPLSFCKDLSFHFPWMPAKPAPGVIYCEQRTSSETALLMCYELVGLWEVSFLQCLFPPLKPCKLMSAQVSFTFNAHCFSLSTACIYINLGLLTLASQTFSKVSSVMKSVFPLQVKTLPIVEKPHQCQGTFF